MKRFYSDLNPVGMMLLDSGSDLLADERKMRVWRKARIVKNLNPDEMRMDSRGSLIKFSEYGNRGSIYGWEIDHITPKAEGGNDKMENLQPLQWQNNLAKRMYPNSLVGLW